ncbi:DUF5689 domain-containing protein [Bacteroidales bacterium OttesenSCG-928-C03]|nr:DUF5689 domain-containing protein [Bacteroidales bacterium OttesenSCG-928-C03]
MKKHIALLSIFALFIVSCDRELDHAPIMTYDGDANCTISQLLAFHEIGSTDSATPIPDSVVISGIVVSSDKHGNCYKYITIQDSTGGVQIKINSTVLYNKYKVGQQVYVKCSGLDLGDYRKLPQIGWWLNGSMEAIPTNREANYIYRNGLPKTEPKPIEISATNQLTAEKCNMLVKVKDVTFVNGGTATFSEAHTSTSRNANFASGGTIIVRTSNYADFAAEMLPTGTGSITGILTRYNNDYQLTIRSLDDLSGFVSEKELYTENFTSDPFTRNWQNVSVTGSNSWRYLTSQKVDITGTTEEDNDVWLISPNVDLRNSTNIKLSLTHRIPGGMGTTENMKIYYSTSASSSFNENDWTELPLSTFPSSVATTLIDIPASAAGKANFKLAFRYHDQRVSNWTIENVTITSTTIQ